METSSRTAQQKAGQGSVVGNLSYVHSGYELIHDYYIWSHLLGVLLNCSFSGTSKWITVVFVKYMLYLKQKLHSSTEIMHYTVCVMQVVRLQGYSMIPSDAKKN